MSWMGIKIRKGSKLGKVVGDSNGVCRILSVKFEDGTEDVIVMSNIGPDPKKTKEFEWYCENEGSIINKTWVRF